MYTSVQHIASTDWHCLPTIAAQCLMKEISEWQPASLGLSLWSFARPNIILIDLLVWAIGIAILVISNETSVHSHCCVLVQSMGLAAFLTVCTSVTRDQTLFVVKLQSDSPPSQQCAWAGSNVFCSSSSNHEYLRYITNMLYVTLQVRWVQLQLTVHKLLSIAVWTSPLNWA